LSTKQELGGYQDLQVEIHLDHGSELRSSDSKAQSFKLTHERAEDGTNYNIVSDLRIVFMLIWIYPNDFASYLLMT